MQIERVLNLRSQKAHKYSTGDKIRQKNQLPPHGTPVELFEGTTISNFSINRKKIKFNLI